MFYVMFFGVLVVEEGGCSFLALGKTNKRRKGTREEGKLFPSEAIFGLEEAVYLLIRARGFSRNLPLAQSSEPIINDLACKLCASNDQSGMQLSISPNPGWIIYIFTDIPKRFRCAFRFLEAVACEWSSKSSHCRSLLHINRFSSVQIISNLSHISISSYYVHSHFI